MRLVFTCLASCWYDEEINRGLGRVERGSELYEGSLIKAWKSNIR